MREMESTTLSTEVQDIQNSTKDRLRKNGGLREISPFVSKITLYEVSLA